MMTLEIDLLEREILRLAKELKIKDKHIQRLLDGTYRAISLTKNSTTKKVVIVTKLSSKNYPIIKTTKMDNQEIIKKMEEFVYFARLYRHAKKGERLMSLHGRRGGFHDGRDEDTSKTD